MMDIDKILAAEAELISRLRRNWFKGCDLAEIKEDNQVRMSEYYGFLTSLLRARTMKALRQVVKDTTIKNKMSMITKAEWVQIHRTLAKEN